MTKVFVSYRRDDSAGHAGRLFDDLKDVYGRDNLFRDIDSIRPGDDFQEVLRRQLAQCDVMLVVIGPRWIGTDGGEQPTPRLHQPEDYVRMELAAALQRPDVRVLPVCVHNAEVPEPEQLPADVQPLAYRQAVELRDARWDDDIHHLIDVIGRPRHRLLQFARDHGWKVAAASVVVVGLGLGVPALVSDGTAGGTGTGNPGQPTATPTPSPTDTETIGGPGGLASPSPSPSPSPDLFGPYRINFQSADVETPEGFLKDYGQPFGTPTSPGQPDDLDYGWVEPGTSEPKDMTAHARDRGFSPQVSQELDTLMHFRDLNDATGELEQGDWEMAVPDGEYIVTVTVGEPNLNNREDYQRHRHTLFVEGTAAVEDFRPIDAGRQQVRSTVSVAVDDGRLTLSTPDDVSTKINSLTVVEQPPR